MGISPRQNVPLAEYSTLELGGPAKFLYDAKSGDEVLEALTWAEAKSVPVFILGGGSNVVIPDEGWEGLVIRVGCWGISYGVSDDLNGSGDDVFVDVGAGESWDRVVGWAVSRDLAGIECLSGIPGMAGATPIQNVGAYGQEVSGSIASVRVIDRRNRQVLSLSNEECEFSYRDSMFKRVPDRYVVLSVKYRLKAGAGPVVRYRELSEYLRRTPSSEGGLPRIRKAVLALRKRKSMVFDAKDPNHRSVGSFFINPVLERGTADALIQSILGQGLAAKSDDIPRFPAGGGKVKFAAGWLVERAGFAKGETEGAIGVSTRHALALVHHGGGTTAEYLAFARRVRDAVHDKFGITLVPEPVILGAHAGDPLLPAS